MKIAIILSPLSGGVKADPISQWDIKLILCSFVFALWDKGDSESTSQYSKLLSNFEFWLELAWLREKCKSKTLLVIEIFFTLHRYCTVTAQYWCSVSKAKHDQIFSVTC